MMPKCKWCKEEGNKEEMACHAKPTGKFNKNGTEKMVRSYYHKPCEVLKIKDDEFKEKESLELDKLYEYLRNLHNIDVVDGRMFEKIQDLRNGTVKSGNKKIRRYKSGVTYNDMYNTYKFISSRTDEILRNMDFQTKWNEFSYVFGMMINNLNEVKERERIKNRDNKPQATTVVDFDIKVNKPTEQKKDAMDISQYL